ncbi:MAG: ACP S-malonyltransferase [Desulfobulbaceae bacterium]|nr:ACP S-malonyltransferase [Desulfobulbaceae bacterium]
MKKTAVLFPGQGSQYLGMGKALVEADTEAALIMDTAERISGFPLRRLSFDGPLDELTRVLYLQPALTAVNLMCWQQLCKRLPDWQPLFVAGHSLGEYSALYAAGVLTLEDTLALVTKRGELMEREGARNPGGMTAILGIDLATVEGLLRNSSFEGVAVVANHNTAEQVVLSGDAAGLAAAAALCKAKGAKAIPLKVSVANHSPLVAGAVDDFAAFMARIDFRAPNLPVLFNVSAGLERSPERIRETMAYQIASKVRWLEIVETMVADGVELFVELGPKAVLSGMVKKILPKDSKVLCLQADTPEGLDAVVSAITS